MQPFLHSASIMQGVSVGRRRFSANFQLAFRLIKGLIFLTFLTVLILLIALPGMTFKDIIVCILAFMPTGWGLLLVSYCFFFLFNQSHCLFIPLTFPLLAFLSSPSPPPTLIIIIIIIIWLLIGYIRAAIQKVLHPLLQKQWALHH